MGQRVYLVDDDESVRASAALLLRANGFQVATFGDATSFLAALQPDQPGCVILDISLPGMDGLEAQEQLNVRGIQFPVLILTGAGDVTKAVRAMKNGAIEFLEKPYHESALLAALDNGFRVMRARVSEGGKAQDARDRISRLSNRERQVMQGLLDGLPNKLIAHRLGLSTRTVESFRATLMEKLGVRTLSAAVRIALLANLAPLSELDDPLAT